MTGIKREDCFSLSAKGILRLHWIFCEMLLENKRHVLQTRATIKIYAERYRIVLVIVATFMERFKSQNSEDDQSFYD